jgi:flotillin
VAEADANVEKGRKAAEADRRVYVQQQEAAAVIGENKSSAEIAEAHAELAVRQASAYQRSEVARRQAEAEIQRAQYVVEQERLNADEVVREEIEKRKKEIAAEAEAEKRRREARGDADAVLARYEAEARGMRQVLEAKAAGYDDLIKSCGGDARAATTLLLTEKLGELVQLQVEAIRNLKIDKITVWDSGQADKATTANFVSGLIRSLPALHDIAAMSGLELPRFLGTVGNGGGGAGNGEVKADDKHPAVPTVAK